jgi:hypothetical protein
MEVI